MARACGDVEVYPNFFCISFIDYDSDAEITFEISERKNDLTRLHDYIRNSLKYFISFNGMHYDNIITMYLHSNYSALKNLEAHRINGALKQLNDLVILTDDNDRETQQKYARYKRGHPWETIDLFLYWSKLTRVSRKLSLKSIAVNMNWHRIQELPLGPDHVVKPEEMDAIIEYNLNDCRITKELAQRMKKDINLRAEAKKRYGFHCLSWDGVKLGYNILLKRYSDRIGAEMREVRELRTPRASIDIGALILPVIGFKGGSLGHRTFIEDKALIHEFSSFQGLYQYLKGLTVRSTKEVNCRVMYKGNRYDVKSGGLHTYHGASVVKPGSNQIYEDDDVSSYYPTLGAEWEMIPEHLGSEFAEELNAVRQERLDLKHKGLGKSNDAELLKLAMNGGFYGNTNNEHTAMYDPQCMLTITINGQLFLLMLCERLIDAGATVDMCNTDGITILYDESIATEVRRICKEWEAISRMELESVNYVKVARRDINNYLAIYTTQDKKTGEMTVGYKQKGAFLTEPGVDMSHDNLVIPKALYNYYQTGEPVEEFIRRHPNIYDFCSCQKVSKAYGVYWNGKLQQRLNRYYVTKRGAYLYKSKDGTNMQHMLKDFSVQLFNDYVEKPMSEYNINYEYYIAETNKFLNQLEPIQLSMF